MILKQSIEAKLPEVIKQLPQKLFDRGYEIFVTIAVFSYANQSLYSTPVLYQLVDLLREAKKSVLSTADSVDQLLSSLPVKPKAL